MNAFRTAAAAMIVTAAAACANRELPAPEPTFFVMRHLHKTADAQDPGLTPQGRQCAQALASMLRGRGVAAVFASTTRRARETAEPVASALELTPQDYAPADTSGVAARARAAAGSVVVVGHSNTVPEIVEQLGGARPGPIDESRYAEVWQVARAGGATEMVRIPGC